MADDTTTKDTYENGAVVKFQAPVPTPMEQWKAQMKESDAKLSREVEDLWDLIGIQNAPAIVQTRYAAKKELRAQKPE